VDENCDSRIKVFSKKDVGITRETKLNKKIPAKAGIQESEN